MTNNTEIAERLREIADRLDAQDVEYKPRAYRRAADQIADHHESIAAIVEADPDALTEIEGIGEAIAEKVTEYVRTGTIEELDDLREELPVDMDALTRVEGLGPKRVGTLYRELGIETLDDLERAADAEEIRSVPGFGPTIEAKFADGIPFARQAAARHLLSEVRPLADRVLETLTAEDATERCEVAGSIRRWRATIGDLDVLVATEAPGQILEELPEMAFVSEVIESGERKAAVRTDAGIRTDFRFVEPEDFGAALQYFTGSKDHNVQLRQRALDRGLTVNEYGVFRQETDERIAGETERDVYDALDLPLIPPELREARGELEAGAAGELPDLLEVADLRGDLHTHTEWSDGAASLREMVGAAERVGHAYVAITDHAEGPGVVADTGLSAGAIRDQREEVQTVAQETDLEVLHGVEANIASDGTVVGDHELYDELDLVIASPHEALRQDRETATDRLCLAIETDVVDVIGHPTGRKLGQRSGLSIDIESVATTAAANDVALEVNSHPIRLDLGDELIRAAIDAGADLVISTDAHRPSELELLRYGAHTARRGWAEPGDVHTTGGINAIRSWLG